MVGHETFHAEVIIDASPEEVWSVLTDPPDYAAWNPLLVPVSGEFSEGAEVEYRMTQPNGKQLSFISRSRGQVAYR